MPFDTITRTFTGQATKTIRCWCSIEFVIPELLYSYYERQAGAFPLHCPVGHEFIPAGKSVVERLRDELARKTALLDQRESRIAELRDEAEHLVRRVRGHKAATTRIKRKLSAGRCPSCSQQFKNLGSHMKREHPKWDPKRAADALAEKEAGR